MIDSKITTFEKTVLVGIINSTQEEEKLNEYLAELTFLTFTAGGKVIKVFTLEYIRDERKFDSIIDLEEQIKLDKKTCFKLIEEK